MSLHLSATLTQSQRSVKRQNMECMGRPFYVCRKQYQVTTVCVCVCHIIPQRHLSGVSGQQMKHVIDLQCEVWPRCSCSLIDNGSVLMCFLWGPSSIPLYLRLYEIQMKFIYPPKGHNEIRGDQLKAGSKCY